MNNQRGVIHLLPLLIIVVVIAGGIFLLYKGIVKIPNFSFPKTSLFQKRANVELKTEYNNPFDKNTQFVNPFQKYKNPFVVNR